MIGKRCMHAAGKFGAIRCALLCTLVVSLVFCQTDTSPSELVAKAASDGHLCERIRATPKPVFQPATEEEMLAKAMQFTLWIDRQEAQIVKVEARIISPGTRFRTGTTVAQEFTKINNQVWLPKQMRFHGLVQDGRKDVVAETEQSYSNYKKFRVK